MAAKVLLVEDDRALREALADTLALGGHDYRAVDSAEAALLALAQEPFGLVVSDVNMPGMDGHQLLARIRERLPQLPVLLMTAFGAVERAVDAMRQGAADYLVKPFSFEELAARVQAILRRPIEAVPTVLRVLDIELDPAERTVSRDGVPLSLTLKEFGLLEYFLRHPNQVINREDLIAHLWDFNYESFSNVVDVHVKNLSSQARYGFRTEHPRNGTRDRLSSPRIRPGLYGLIPRTVPRDFPQYSLDFLEAGRFREVLVDA